MATKRDWWVEQYYPFEAGSDGYPHPGQVVAHYRLQMKLTQADIAQFLGISERAVWSMEHTDAGLDSLLRRKILCEKLEIPPPLLRLDALHRQDSDWLAKAGHPRFKLGMNGYPRPGEVARHYRRLMSKEGRKQWSQANMGNILGMYENEKPFSEKAIREMEKKDIGLDSITRREALVTILGIPPVLLGLDALHMPENALSIAKTMPPRLPKSVGIYQQKLTQFQTSLDTYWESHYSNALQGGMREIEKVINELHSGLPYVSERQQRETRVVLCRYHQLAVDIARETRDYARVFAHANNAIILAKGLKDTELIAVTLLQRGEAFFDRGVVQNDLTAAKNDLTASKHHLDKALKYAEHARAPLKGCVLQSAGVIFAHMSQDETDRKQALDLLSQSGKIIRVGDIVDNEHHIKLTEGWNHNAIAMALTAFNAPKQALIELDLADDGIKPNEVRRRAYSNVYRARAYTADGYFPIAATLAEDALNTFKIINSKQGIARVRQVVDELSKSPYGNSFDVVQLRVRLLRL